MDYSFLIDNKYAIGGVLGAIVLLWDKIVPLTKGLVNFKSPNQEIDDQSALRHLRDRAVTSGDADLVKMIREVDAKFYDIHIKTGVKK